MDFGFTLLPRSLEETRATARLGEALGFSWIGVADSPADHEDSYLHQLEVARATESVRVGPMVSHVVARHPVVVGNLLATLNAFSGGRAVGTLATGGSAARGLGVTPATLAELGQGVAAIRSYWRAMERPACPLLIAADGPRAAALARAVGDGLLYGGTLDPEVRRRRLASTGGTAGGRQAWIAPTVSLEQDHGAVRDDLGALVAAMADRALRGDLDERGVPAAVQEDALENATPATERLTDYLIDSRCIWGGEARWKALLDALDDEGWTGVMFMLGQTELVPVLQAVGERLQRLGHLRAPAAA